MPKLRNPVTGRVIDFTESQARVYRRKFGWEDLDKPKDKPKDKASPKSADEPTDI